MWFTATLRFRPMPLSWDWSRFIILCQARLAGGGQTGRWRPDWPVEARLAGGGQTGRWRHNVLRLSIRLFICPSMCLSIRLSVAELVNTIIWKQIRRFWCQLAEMVHGVRAWTDKLWRLRGKKTRTKIDLEAWCEGIILDTFGLSRFLVFSITRNCG